MLSKEHRERLELFNQTADKLINSDFIKESEQKWIGGTYSWKTNEKTENLDYSFKKVSHNETYTEALILNLRKLTQNNDYASIGNLARIYDEMPIDNKYKTDFRDLRDDLNKFLDTPTIQSVNGKPTSRDIFDTFVYGEIAHSSQRERAILNLWKTAQPEWDMEYSQFERILNRFVCRVTSMKKLNDRVLKNYN